MIVYSQRVREAYKDVPIVIGGIEASLRRIAHFDYWSEKVRRSVLLDAKADLLVYGNAERQICEIAHRLAAGEPIEQIDDLRGTAFVRNAACPTTGSRSIRRRSTRRAASNPPSIRTRWRPCTARPDARGGRERKPQCRRPADDGRRRATPAPSTCVRSFTASDRRKTPTARAA